MGNVMLQQKYWYEVCVPAAIKYLSGRGDKRAHTIIAERAMGHSMPKGSVVHHVDGNGLNNKHSNLVVCPSESYHSLLHQRQESYAVSGNPNLRKCPFCLQWDDPSLMGPFGGGKMKNGNKRPRQFWHRKCRNSYLKAKAKNE